MAWFSYLILYLNEIIQKYCFGLALSGLGGKRRDESENGAMEYNSLRNTVLRFAVPAKNHNDWGRQVVGFFSTSMRRREHKLPARRHFNVRCEGN